VIGMEACPGADEIGKRQVGRSDVNLQLFDQFPNRAEYQPVENLVVAQGQRQARGILVELTRKPRMVILAAVVIAGGRQVDQTSEVSGDMGERPLPQVLASSPDVRVLDFPK
jgi:hypothetical protein